MEGCGASLQLWPLSLQSQWLQRKPGNTEYLPHSPLVKNTGTVVEIGSISQSYSFLRLVSWLGFPLLFVVFSVVFSAALCAWNCPFLYSFVLKIKVLLFTLSVKIPCAKKLKEEKGKKNEDTGGRKGKKFKNCLRAFTSVTLTFNPSIDFLVLCKWFCLYFLSGSSHGQKPYLCLLWHCA